MTARGPTTIKGASVHTVSDSKERVKRSRVSALGLQGQLTIEQLRGLEEDKKIYKKDPPPSSCTQKI